MLDIVIFVVVRSLVGRLGAAASWPPKRRGIAYATVGAEVGSHFFSFFHSAENYMHSIYTEHMSKSKKKMANYFSVAYNSIFHSANAVKYGEKK